MEWSEANTFNPMNSLVKGLTYYEHYLKILAWMEGHGKLPAPVEASLDPCAQCNNSCYYCSSNRYRANGATPRQWDMAYMTDLFPYLSQWGVKAFCWGGREATLNPHLAQATRLATQHMEGAIVTNGVYLPDELKEALLTCKWIGVSVDTTSAEVYRQVRGTDDCKQVWGNIADLGRSKNGTTVGVRALILPETVDTLYDTCYRARESGATFFHCRPADLERKDLADRQKATFDMPRVRDILRRCHELETSEFGVFTVTHKYGEDFHVRHDFKRCLASPLVVQICTDKRKYLCVDHRMDPRYEVTEWGGDQHRDLINSIVPDRDCSRCTWDAYQRIIEQIVMTDRIHRNFP